jgi:hypothetical protein
MGHSWLMGGTMPETPPGEQAQFVSWTQNNVFYVNA